MKIAIVRIRGNVRVPSEVLHTLKLLGLNKKNHCTIVEETPHLQGMLKKITHYATWGPVDEKTAEALNKKGKTAALSPPRKGYGRKGVKMPYELGGAYGDRKEKINDLLARMM
ncbi:MAG: uL30 family ribosomal protein [Candidatus Woesearchaeota archaeon]